MQEGGKEVTVEVTILLSSSSPGSLATRHSRAKPTRRHFTMCQCVSTTLTTKCLMLYPVMQRTSSKNYLCALLSKYSIFEPYKYSNCSPTLTKTRPWWPLMNACGRWNIGYVGGWRVSFDCGLLTWHTAGGRKHDSIWALCKYRQSQKDLCLECVYIYVIRMYNVWP